MYNDSDTVKALLKDIEDWSAKTDFVSEPSQMRRISVGLMKILLRRSGHRPEVLGQVFTRGHFVAAYNAPPAVNPYQLADPQRHGEDGETHPVDNGARVYVRRNPWAEDPLDRDDPMNDPDKFELHKGRCVEVTRKISFSCLLFHTHTHPLSFQIRKHKTTDYICYIWFSEALLDYMLGYDDLADR